MHTALVGMKLKDGLKIAADVKKFVKSLPELIQKLAQIDAGKINGVNYHLLPLGAMLPDEVKKIFGKNETLALAFTKDSVLIVFGIE